MSTSSEAASMLDRLGESTESTHSLRSMLQHRLGTSIDAPSRTSSLKDVRLEEQRGGLKPGGENDELFRAVSANSFQDVSVWDGIAKDHKVTPTPEGRPATPVSVVLRAAKVRLPRSSASAHRSFDSFSGSFDAPGRTLVPPVPHKAATPPMKRCEKPPRFPGLPRAGRGSGGKAEKPATKEEEKKMDELLKPERKSRRSFWGRKASLTGSFTHLSANAADKAEPVDGGDGSKNSADGGSSGDGSGDKKMTLIRKRRSMEGIEDIRPLLSHLTLRRVSTEESCPYGSGLKGGNSNKYYSKMEKHYRSQIVLSNLALSYQ